MSWKTIVAGVDASPEGARAAGFASRLARAAGVPCILAHALQESWTELALAGVPVNVTEQNRLLLESTRTLVSNVIAPEVTPAELDGLDIRFGSPGIILREVADAHDAGLVVLGGKHHSRLGRWIAGSTAHFMVRSMDRPLLVIGDAEATAGIFRRILVPVDFSAATQRVIEMAKLAAASGADIRLLHVVEPLPSIPDMYATSMVTDLVQRAEERLTELVRDVPGADWLVRTGPAAAVIARAVAEWGADLVVVGSHGKGWVDRVLIGSVTEKLLDWLPASMLILPVPSHVAKPVSSSPGPSARGRTAKTG